MNSCDQGFPFVAQTLQFHAMPQATSSLRFVEPFWWSGSMLGESILPIRSTDKPGVTVELAFAPVEILTVTSCDGQQSYEEGRDFHWQAGDRHLHIPAGSRIPTFTEDELYRPANSQQHGKCRDRDNDILFAPRDEYHRMQTAVTYRMDLGDWQPPTGLRPVGTLPRTAALLAGSQPLKVVLLGDSITVGFNASNLFDVPPHMPPYGPMVCDAMSEQFGVPVEMKNLAVGGKTSEWGLTQLDAVIEQKPDVVLLAFGMNDASHECDPAEFQGNIRKMITTIQSKLPDTEFVLVASMTANSQWIYATPALYPRYRDVQSELQTQGIVLADVYSLWQEMVDRKGYLTFTGNGLNHPNDFGHRIYAQAVWTCLMHAMGKYPIDE
jgi:lysophospholipase L1-like esterase